MKVGDRVWIERYPPTARPVHPNVRLVLVVEVRGDYVHCDIPGHTFPKAFHRRTGRMRRGGWKLSDKHCDPRAGKQKPL